MATAKKTQRKNTSKSLAVDTDEFYICVTCGRKTNKQKGNYKPSRSPRYAGNNGYLPVCISCLDKELKRYNDEYDDEKAAMRRICMAWDIYYNPDLHRIAKGGRGIDFLLGAYFSQMNLGQWDKENMKTFDDTLREEAGERIESVDEVRENKDLKITAKTVKFWGTGYEPDEYKFLDDEYTSWVIRANNGEAPSKSLENTLKEMCATQVDIKRARKDNAKSSEISSLQNTYLKLMESAGLKPNQEDTGSIAEKNALGVLIDVWEETEPVPKYPDENKLIKYISIWFKGHLAKASNLNNDTKEEYDSEIEKYKVKILEDTPTVLSDGESDG